MKIIERAQQRLYEEDEANRNGADNDYSVSYWAAYLDGARAQLKEDAIKASKSTVFEDLTFDFLKSVRKYCAQMVVFIDEDFETSEIMDIENNIKEMNKLLKEAQNESRI